MGCGSSVAAAAQPRPHIKSPVSVELMLVPGQTAIIRNCPNTSLNGERVVCEEYNASLGEWLVKGDKFPLAIGMSLGAQFLAQFLEPIGGGVCPSGHTLHLQEVPACFDSSTCDICGEDIPKGRILWGCRSCEYEKCSKCASFNAIDAKPQVQSSDSLQLGPTLLRSNSSSPKASPTLVPGKLPAGFQAPVMSTNDPALFLSVKMRTGLVGEHGGCAMRPVSKSRKSGKIKSVKREEIDIVKRALSDAMR